MVKKGKVVNRYIADYAGYGKKDPRKGSHLKKHSNSKICATLTTLCAFNKCVVEEIEIDEENENTDL